MTKTIVALMLVLLFAAPVSAQEWTAPLPPDPALDLMPEAADTFWEGVSQILKNALPQLLPSFSECLRICCSIAAVAMLLAILQTIPGTTESTAHLAGGAAISILLLRSSNSLIALGAETVRSISEYGKQLLPIMTAALAGSGGTGTSAALYAGTVFFDAILGSLVSTVLIPLIYVFLCLSVAKCALGDSFLKKLSDFIKWVSTWCLKLVLYAFTGYISITGVISGTADAAAIKATKLTISGMVPVVGGILSDASEAVLVSAGLIRSMTGVYGLLASASICILPFLQIGVQYLLLQATGAVCDIFSDKRCVELIRDFAWSMGMLLAMTGTGCLLVMVSVICFMRGVG